MIELRWLRGVNRKGAHSIRQRGGGDWPDEFYTLQYREWPDGLHPDNEQGITLDWQDVPVTDDRRYD